MIHRLLFLLLGVGLAVMAAAAQAEQQGRVPVVGLVITHPLADDPVIDLFRTGLQKYGYEDGKNIKLEVRTALGRLDRVPGLAEQLVRLPADVLVVLNEVALRVTRQATHTIPIVMVGYTDDPVARGWVESYRRPGGNVTGIFNVNAALTAKRLEILKEAVPNLSQVAVLWDAAFGKRQLDELQGAARSLNVRLDFIEIRGPNDLEAAFKAAKAQRGDAVMMMFSPMFYLQRVRVAALGIETGLPTITEHHIAAEAGCLLSYGADRPYNWERVAYFVDRLLTGANAAELPVEQISKLRFVVNLRTARALGLTIPESILLRADELVQ
jgi:ABC-type uncharacterized transport system substrate-binding protein